MSSLLFTSNINKTFLILLKKFSSSSILSINSIIFLNLCLFPSNFRQYIHNKSLLSSWFLKKFLSKIFSFSKCLNIYKSKKDKSNFIPFSNLGIKLNFIFSNSSFKFIPSSSDKSIIFFNSMNLSIFFLEYVSGSNLIFIIDNEDNNFLRPLPEDIIISKSSSFKFLFISFLLLISVDM